MKTIVDLETDLVKPYIDVEDKKFAANIAPVETSPATGAHAVGSQIIYNGVLYDVTAAIAATDALVVGTNIAAADDVVTELSSLKNALSDEVETRATLGAHQLLDNKALTTTFTDSDKTIIFTVNSDKSVTVNGETGSSTNRGLILNSSVPTKSGVKYILSGCPSGGSANTYDVSAYSSDFAINVRDFGEGVEFTGNGDTITVRVWVKNSTAVNNKVFYPQIRLATDADTTYRPYVPTNAQLLSYKDNGVLGAKNFIYPTENSQAVNGVVFTVNSDGTVLVNGTNSVANPWVIPIAANILLKKGSYILSGVPEGAYSSGSGCILALINSSTSAGISTDYGSGAEFTLAEDTTVTLRFYVTASASISNKTFKPMIRLTTDSDATYQPYAMTNRELTDAVTPIEITPTWSVNIDAYGNTHFYKVGNVLYAFFHIGVKTDAIAADNWYTIAELPSGVRPKAQSRGTVISSDANSIQLLFAADGTIQIYSKNTALAVGKQIIGCSFTIL